MANVEQLQRVTYSVAEVTDITGLGRTTLYKLMNEGQLPSIKVGRRRLVKAEHLRQLFAVEGQAVAQ